MSKASKIVLIIVAVLVAIGAAIGIYFAVKGRNPYTKEQQTFIDEIINSNKPNNPPVDIGGGTLPGGVVGEDETGDTVIVDTGTGSDAIWQKDPTDPNGGYDKVDTPTSDDEGHPFTYQTVVQICGNFALVQNDVGNHAVINLAETEVVLNYTDLQDAENLKIISNYLVCTTMALNEEATNMDSVVLQNVYIVNLYDVQWEQARVDKDEDGVINIAYLSNQYCVLYGLTNVKILKIDETIQAVYEKAIGYKQLSAYGEEDISSYDFILNGICCAYTSYVNIAELNNGKIFLEEQVISTTKPIQGTYYSQSDNFGNIKYIQSTCYIYESITNTTISLNKNFMWYALDSVYSEYTILIQYTYVADAVNGYVLSEEYAKYVYFNNENEEILSMPMTVGYIINYSEKGDYFVCKKGDTISLVDRYGKFVYKELSNLHIVQHDTKSSYMIVKDDGVYFQVYDLQEKQLLETFYVDYSYSWQGYYILQKTVDGVDFFDVYNPDRQIETFDNVVCLNAYIDEMIRREGYLILKDNELYKIYRVNGEVVIDGVDSITYSQNGNKIYIYAQKEDRIYTYPFNISNFDSGEGITNLNVPLVQDASVEVTVSYKKSSITVKDASGKDVSLTEYEHMALRFDKTSFNAGDAPAATDKIITDSQYFNLVVDLSHHHNGAIEGFGRLYWNKCTKAVIQFKNGYFLEGAAEGYDAAAVAGNNPKEYVYIPGSSSAGASSSSHRVYLNEKSSVKYMSVRVKPTLGYNIIIFTSKKYGTKNLPFLISLTHGDENKQVRCPKLDGYRFLGFYTVDGDIIFDENGKQVGDYEVKSRGIVTLVAHWEPLVTTVNFSSNSSGDYQVVSSQYYTYGEGVPKLTINAPEKIGYNFLGWYTGKNGQGTRVFYNDGNVAETSISTGYIKSTSQGYVWNRNYDYNISGANEITLYAHYTPKNMNVQVTVVADDEGVDIGQLRYKLLGGNWFFATSKTHSQAYLYDAANITNSIEIKMSEALGYYISEFKITWTTFNNDNELNTSLNGTSNTYESIEATNSMQGGIVVSPESGGQAVVAIAKKSVSGNTATYSFDFKSGTGQDSSYLNTWSIALTIYINIDLIITPPDTVQTSAESIHVEPVILPQNRKEEA